MAESAGIPQRSDGNTWTWRFGFDSYSETRRFLDELAERFRELGYHPNLSFQRTQVTVSIDADARTAFGAAAIAVADALDELARRFVDDEGAG
jgi:4a-hydroxytetrahydrobiopterin dehydratase